MTQVLVDLKYHERSMIWTEFWHGGDQSEPKPRPIFRTRKHNLPKKYKSPNGLKSCLESIKSELIDHKNRIHQSPNLPEDELLALKELVKLQKERQIIIKRCDKGAGVILLNFED